MFNGFYELEYLDLSNFITENVADMSFIFNRCNKLKNINLSNFFLIEKLKICWLFKINLEVNLLLIIKNY